METETMAGEQLYKHRPEKKGFDIMCAAEFFGAIYYDVPTGKRKEKQYPRGEWYCHSQNCVVREVQIYCKLYGKRMPKMKCPACGEAMKFHHWLESRTLIPVKPTEGQP